MDYSNVVADGEVVLWDGRPRLGRIFAVQDFYMVPFSLIWTAFAVAGSLLIRDMAWPFKVVSLAAAAYLTVGRFIYKAIVKSQTKYVVTDQRALVLRQGEIYEHQELDGVKPEITGWNHNRIVTFGDALDSALGGMGRIWTPDENLGMPRGRFTVRRGDGSEFPIRFYDLDPAEGERLIPILKDRAHQRSIMLDGGVASVVSLDASNSIRDATNQDGETEQGDQLPAEDMGRIARWTASSPWRFVLLPAFLVTAVTAGFAALTHSPSEGLLPGLMVGVSSYLVYRRKYGQPRK